jgi:hypothetical protein
MVQDKSKPTILPFLLLLKLLYPSCVYFIIIKPDLSPVVNSVLCLHTHITIIYSRIALCVFYCYMYFEI